MKAARAAVRQAKALEGTSEEIQALREQVERLEAKLDALLAANGVLVQVEPDGELTLLPPVGSPEIGVVESTPETDTATKTARRGRQKAEASNGDE